MTCTIQPINSDLNDENRKKYSDQHYLKTDKEMEELFYELQKVLLSKNISNIAAE